MLVKRYPLNIINIFLQLLLLLFSFGAYSSPWLDEGGDATISASLFSTSKFDSDAYKGYLNYGFSDNWNIALQVNYRKPLSVVVNEFSIKRKILNRDFSVFQLAIAAELSNFSTFAAEIDSFSFTSSKLASLFGLKVGDFFMVIKPSMLFDLNKPVFELLVEAGYDYSEYNTIMFGTSYSPFGGMWKVMWLRNIIGDVDVGLEYINCVDGYNKLGIGLWYRLRP